MKRLMLVVLLMVLAACVRGETIAHAANKVGGEIYLTDKPSATCQQDMYVVYSTAPDAPQEFGCWSYDEQNIYIVWSDGATNTYPIGTFHPMREGNK